MSWLFVGRILKAGFGGVSGAMCVAGERGRLTDLNACCGSCRTVGLSQRRGLWSHIQISEAGMYGVEGRGAGEGREEGG